MIKSNKNVKNDFEVKEDQYVCSFDVDETSLGECISVFSFDNDKDFDSKSLSSTIISDTCENTNEINNGSENSTIYNLEDEASTIKRSYNLRTSTIRKLNELKSIHPNLTVSVSTIVDSALDHYYTYITKESGTFM
ncbi:MAG: hypothetical protein E7208_12730 [Clostridium butyricum]|nr:hypothetical protein [Clostridium butyricum]